MRLSWVGRTHLLELGIELLLDVLPAKSSYRPGAAGEQEELQAVPESQLPCHVIDLMALHVRVGGRPVLLECLPD